MRLSVSSPFVDSKSKLKDKTKTSDSYLRQCAYHQKRGVSIFISKIGDKIEALKLLQLPAHQLLRGTQSYV